jgi:hypothetical protein
MSDIKLPKKKNKQTITTSIDNDLIEAVREETNISGIKITDAIEYGLKVWLLKTNTKKAKDLGYL